MLLAEANQWPEDAVSPIWPRRQGMPYGVPFPADAANVYRGADGGSLSDNRYLGADPPIDETCQWALFLRNHDELTLEMVTDEERDYMYRAYAQDARMRINLGIRRRLAPLLGNHRRAIDST
jgi:maltose alpha-D-glucosyltransferase/alpha-amylase